MSATPGYPGVPAFFRRVYDQTGARMIDERNGVVFFTPTAGMCLIIYGFAVRSEFPEDQPNEDVAWREHKTFMAECFSPLAPEGECGFVPLSECEEITKDDFISAQKEGWPQ